MSFNKALYPNTNLFIHALFGSCLGLLTSIIFLVLYYGTHYDIPVPDSIRFRGAFWATVIIVFVVWVIFFYKDILAYLNKAFGSDNNEESE
jgi:hypothetical protein